MLPKKIILVGMPGSGKSTLGKRMASLLNYAFIDLDATIELSEGRSISQIFASDGEDHFRMIEHYTLKNLLEKYSKFVLATGGGTPCYYNNIELINEVGISVFLNTPLEKIAERIERNNTKRPMFTNLRKVEILVKLQEIFYQRQGVYANSHHTVALASPEIVIELLRN